MRKNVLHRCFIVSISCLVLWAGGALPAVAKAVFGNFMVGSARTDGDYRLYDYGAGTSALFTTQADFVGGTLANTTATTNPGSVAVDTTSVWQFKRCYTVNHTIAGASTVGEYPMSITLDTAALIAAGKMQTSGADLRAVAATGAPMPLWIEGAMNTTTTVIWVQVPQIIGGASTSFCLYYGNASATTVSDPLGPFTYSVKKSVYYPVSKRYTSNPTSLSVASFGPNNQVTVGATTINLATSGATGSFASGIAQPAVPIEVLGPINGRGAGAGFDAIAPISFAGTNFSVPLLYWSTSRLSIVAPFATATVTILQGTTPVVGSPFTIPAGTALESPAFTVNNVSAVVTSNVPVLVSQVDNVASLAAIPLNTSTSTWYGVYNTFFDVGFTAAGSAAVRRSDGTLVTLNGTAGSDTYLGGSATAGGSAAEGVAITGTVAIFPYADSLDMASFLPAGELSTQYVLPTAASYLTFSCPTIGTVIQVGGLGNVTCATSGAGPFPAGTPGKAIYNGAVPAGTIVKTLAPSTNPFYMYYADTGLETNAWGPKQGRQVTYPAPTLVAGSETAISGVVGSWTSPVINTASTGVFGTLAWNATLPAGTTINFRVAGAATAAGPWTYVGPDGTAATSYTSTPGALPFSFDGLCCIRLQATLTTQTSATTPLLNDVTARYNLPLLAHTPGTPSSATVNATAGVATTAYIARVKTSSSALVGSTATLRELGTSTLLSNLSSATLRFELPVVNQIVVAGGTVVTSVGPATTIDATNPQSIAIVVQPTAAGITSIIRTTLVLDVGPIGGSPLIDNDVNVQVVS